MAPVPQSTSKAREYMDEIETLMRRMIEYNKAGLAASS